MIEDKSYNLASTSVPSLVKVSLVMTVRNEAESMGPLLRSILAGSVRPDEIVIADGGSTDNTAAIVQAYASLLPIRLISVPGANISEGRNAAIRAARHEVIACTDAGVRLSPDWLAHLVEPFNEDALLDVVSGFFLPDPQTPFEVAMGATVLPTLEDVDPGTFLPSSRSIAFRREAWERAGGYPEWLDYCEDLVFDMSLKREGARFRFAPEALVYFRPRSDLGAFFVQYFRYSRGDGKANLWPRRHAARYAAYNVGPLLAFWALRKRGFWGALIFFALLTAAGLYMRRPVERLLPHLEGVPLAQAAWLLLLVPVIRVTGDFAKMIGYPVGVLWRLRNG
jgi:glycosyltransferase involved in cell wall biosynthesis